jgi:hypothetical protein
MGFGCRVRAAFGREGNGKRERRTAVIRLCPETTVMAFDESRPTPASRTVVRTPSGLAFSLDEQVPRTVVHAGHRLRGIAKQVEDHLLELHSIASDSRELISELQAKHNPVSMKVAQRQFDDLSCGLVQIERLERDFLLVKSACDAR